MAHIYLPAVAVRLMLKTKKNKNQNKQRPQTTIIHWWILLVVVVLVSLLYVTCVASCTQLYLPLPFPLSSTTSPPPSFPSTSSSNATALGLYHPRVACCCYVESLHTFEAHLADHLFRHWRRLVHTQVAHRPQVRTVHEYRFAPSQRGGVRVVEP